MGEETVLLKMIYLPLRTDRKSDPALVDTCRFEEI